jgi:putative addiction module component (TIGR02574 family)
MDAGMLDETLDANSAAVPVTQAQKDELDQRLDDLEQHPEGGRSWEEFRSEIEHQE